MSCTDLEELGQSGVLVHGSHTGGLGHIKFVTPGEVQTQKRRGPGRGQAGSGGHAGSGGRATAAVGEEGARAGWDGVVRGPAAPPLHTGSTQ